MSQLPEKELESTRLLHGLQLLSTEPEERFDRLTRLAQSLFSTPIALVSLMDDGRQWFKSYQGIENCDLSGGESFCIRALMAPEILEISDTHLDESFVDNPLVTAAPHVRFYAGVPLSTSEGHRIGTLCIMDTMPRVLSSEQRIAFRDLADCVEDEIHAIEGIYLREKLAASESRFGDILESLPDIVFVVDREGRFISCNEHPDLIVPKNEIIGRLLGEILPLTLAARCSDAMAETLMTGEQISFEYSLDLPRGLVEFEARLRRLGDSEILIVIRNTDKEKAAAIELERQRDFAALLINIAPIVVVVLDIRGVILQTNAYFERLTGCPIGEAVGQDWFSTFLLESDQQSSRALFEQSTLGVPTRGAVYPIVSRSGETRDMEWSDQAIRDAEGNVTGLLAIGLDISERKKQSQHTQLSLERLNQAQRIAKVGSWELDLQSGTLDWTDEIYNLFELDKEHFEATYEAFLNAIHPDDREAVNAAYAGSLVSRAAYAITHRLLMSDGRIKWVEERCDTEFSGDGTPLVSRGTVQDISERREIEGDLQLKNVAIATAIDAIIIVSADGQIVYANPAFMTMWQYDADLESLLAASPNDLWSYSAENEIDARQSILSGDTWTGQAMATRRDGSRFPVQLSSTGLYDDDKQLTHLMASFVDITEVLRTERIRSEFVSTVSHELRTPLTSISGALGLIIGGALGKIPEEIEAMIAIAYRNSHTLGLLVDDLLDMDKISSGKMHFDMHPQPLRPLLLRAVEVGALYRSDRRVNLALNEDMPDVDVLVDSDRLMQVFNNLLSNAIKFSPEGGVVQVGVELISGFVRVTVSDDGPGIPEGFHDHVFEKFAQADSSDTRAMGGTGLGLAISRELVEYMRGKIGFESVEGEGAHFFVDLPAW